MLNQAHVQRSRFAFPLLLLVAWTAFGLFFGTQTYLRDVYTGQGASLPGYIVSWLLCGYSWAILTVPVMRLARRAAPQTIGWPRFFLTHIPCGALTALLQLGLYVVISTLLFGSRGRGIWGFYKLIAVSEFQTSFLVYFVVVSAITAYDRWLVLPENDSIPRSQNGNSSEFIRRLAVKENGRIIPVDVENINWIESYGNYVFLHTPVRRFVVRQTMAALEKKLDPEQFVRIRRSAIVRAEQITELRLGAGGEFEVTLRCGQTIPSTRRYRKNLENFIRA